MEKRGISPVIATVLLIVIVIILALIVFMWARGFVKEAVLKKGKPAEQACEEIKLELMYLDSELQITNTGNVPVYSFKIKKKLEGEIEMQEENGLISGQSKSIEIGEDYKEIEVFPVILGEAKLAKKAYVCKKSFVVS